MEAAHIAWRPLGQLLVEQGMLTSSELEQALAKQQETGKRLGETIVELGFVSGPQLASALASQYGIELKTEKGFGTGLRSQILRRHESDRLSEEPAVATLPAPTVEHVFAFEPEPEPEPPATQVLLAPLEEQWARLAAAESTLAERDREVLELLDLNAQLHARIDELQREPVAVPAPEPPPEPTSHLLFVQLEGRYALVQRDGPPPLDRDELALPDIDEGVFVVSGRRPSPLPGDSRPCVVAVRA